MTTMKSTVQRSASKTHVNFNSSLVAPDGLGYGEGTISYAARAGTAVNVSELEAAIGSPDVLVPVDCDDTGKVLDDDGCGDGRKAVRVQEGKIVRKRSLNRAKVFGGGATMTVAALIGLDRAGDLPLNELFRTALRQLQAEHIGYGAHTDNHHTDPRACGCGAIDKAPRIIQNAVNFREQIQATIQALGVDTNGLDDIFATYAKYAALVAKDKDYAGRQVADDIIDSGVVVKDLGDDHKEMYIVLNYVQGFTVNQEHIRAMTDGQAQVFGADVWRMQDLAQRAFPGESTQAFLSELVYTLAVAATLTKGDLPVYVIQAK